MRSFLLFLALSSTPAFTQQISAVPNEPANIDAMKQSLKAYEACTDDNCYVPQLKRQSDIALLFLKHSVATAKPGEKLALVLDIDETSLSNWATEMKDDFGYIPADSNQCVVDHCSKVIPTTLQIFNEALKNNVTVFFITGRPETQRADTEANLKSEGYDNFKHVYLRPVDHPRDQSVSDYKSGERGKIVADGYRIILNMGDQFSDLDGPYQADHSVKLPNPFYFIK